MKHYNKKERPKKGDVVVTGGIPQKKTYDEAFKVVAVIEKMELLKVTPLVGDTAYFWDDYTPGLSVKDFEQTNDAPESFLNPSSVHLVTRTAE